MSRMTSVSSVANTLIAPLVPAATMAALERTRPSSEVKVATVGWLCPAGQTVTYPRVFLGTTATFSEYAPAVEGMPQTLFGMTKSRDVWPVIDGPPNGPLA